MSDGRKTGYKLCATARKMEGEPFNQEVVPLAPMWKESLRRTTRELVGKHCGGVYRIPVS
jgi:hypothetical protein